MIRILNEPSPSTIPVIHQGYRGENEGCSIINSGRVLNSLAFFGEKQARQTNEELKKRVKQMLNTGG